jgi:hypothetical protein
LGCGCAFRRRHVRFGATVKGMARRPTSGGV